MSSHWPHLDLLEPLIIKGPRVNVSVVLLHVDELPSQRLCCCVVVPPAAHGRAYFSTFDSRRYHQDCDFCQSDDENLTIVLICISLTLEEFEHLSIDIFTSFLLNVLICFPFFSRICGLCSLNFLKSPFVQ